VGVPVGVAVNATVVGGIGVQVKVAVGAAPPEVTLKRKASASPALVKRPPPKSTVKSTNPVVTI
jgi:hypothetical protein